MSMKKEEYNVSILELVLLLKRNIVLLIVLSIIGGALGFSVANYVIPPVYEASAKMIVNTKKSEDYSITTDQITSAQNLVKTYSIIIRSRTVLEGIIDKYDIDTTYEELQEMIGVSAVDGTQVMEVSVKNTDGVLAKNILTEILKTSPKIIMDSVEAGSVKTIEDAYLSDEPVEPNKMQITVLSALVGFMAALFIIIARFAMDTTYKSKKDVVEDLGIPVLSVIPDIESCIDKKESMSRKRK